MRAALMGAILFASQWTGLISDVNAAGRVALVIGNSAYSHAQRLTNPANDARSIADVLQRIGFQVVDLTDLGVTEFTQALAGFADRSAGAEMAVFYYAGHGMEFEGENYLIPVDARLQSELRVHFEAVNLNDVMAAMAGVKGTKVVLLDACRDNPFAVSLKRGGATRSVSRGLTRIEPAAGTLIAYAAKAGTTADDGDGAHSPFASALIRHLDQPGLEISFLFRKVRDSVVESTNGRQEPATYLSLPGKEVYLVPGEGPVAAPATTVPRSGEDEAGEVWKNIQASDSIAVLNTFIERFPSSVYADLAKARRSELEQQANAVQPDETTSPLQQDRKCELGRVVRVRPVSAYDHATGSGFLAVREGPGAGYNQVGEIYRDDDVEVLECAERWVRIACLSGRCVQPLWGPTSPIGWVSARYLKTRKSQQCPPLPGK